MTWATDHIFVAGGDFIVEDWRGFQDQTGVGAVIAVSAVQPAGFYAPAPAALLWLPVDDESQYTLDHLRLGVQFMRWALAAGHTVLLYAPKGVHRTRPLVAAHLVAGGKSIARVVRDLERKPWLPPYKGNVALLERLSAQPNGID